MENRKMEMKPEDIRKEFQEAKDKRAQIKILSERNLCSREDIIEILKEQGIKEEDIPQTRGRRQKNATKKKTAIPQSVKDAIAARIVQLTEEAEEKEHQVKELRDFLEVIQEAEG